MADSHSVETCSQDSTRPNFESSESNSSQFIEEGIFRIWTFLVRDVRGTEIKLRSGLTNQFLPECSTDISLPFIFIPDNFSMALSNATLSCRSTKAKPRLFRTMFDTSICFSRLFKVFSKSVHLFEKSLFFKRSIDNTLPELTHDEFLGYIGA